MQARPIERLVELLGELVAVDSVNPTLAGGPGEGRIAEMIRRRLSGLGYAVERQELGGGRANVAARVPGRTDRPALVLNGHLDTVGVEGMAAPFVLRRAGDRLSGRGAYDMKGGVAVMLALAEAWAAEPPGRDVWLTFSADEEDRSLGTEALVAHWLPRLNPRPAAAVFLEPTEEGIGVAHKGFAWCEIEIFGRAAHGSRPEQGIDAVLPLAGALAELARIRAELAAQPPDPLLGCATLHGGVVAGGSALSVVPAHARLKWERRTLPGEDPGAVAAELARVAAATEGLPGGHRVAGRQLFSRPAYRTPPGAGIVAALKRAAPRAPEVGVSFWTDAALMGAAGVPSVLFGPSGHGAHAADEWVSAASLAGVYEALRKAVHFEW
jgi:acetylornithine deacetylase